ncbi:hypothetical protein T09_14541 [Trichinella sp. T9]|nr:hypothetical protein T09_14541 [Trichinella sp. T9]
MQPSNSITARSGIFTFPLWNILQHMPFIWKILNSRHSSPINLMALQMRYDISITACEEYMLVLYEEASVGLSVALVLQISGNASRMIQNRNNLFSRPLECVIMYFPHYLDNSDNNATATMAIIYFHFQLTVFPFCASSQLSKN